MDTSIEEIEFVASSEHRTGALDALVGGPCKRNALQEMTAASSATIGRILGDFEDRRWITRDGAMYELTPLGEFVAEQFGNLREAMETERKLRDVWQWLPREMDGFSVGLFTDLVVAYPGPGYPYEPVERVSQLIEGTSMMYGFGTTVFKSVNNEAVCRAVLDGMDFEYIYDPEVLERTVAWNPERVAEATSRENCTIYLHDDLPDNDRCGLGIFDDRVGICCHDAETAVLEAVFDTGAPEAREWAVSVFEQYRDEARLLQHDETADLFPSEPTA